MNYLVVLDCSASVIHTALREQMVNVAAKLNEILVCNHNHFIKWVAVGENGHMLLDFDSFSKASNLVEYLEDNELKIGGIKHNAITDAIGPHVLYNYDAVILISDNGTLVNDAQGAIQKAKENSVFFYYVSLTNFQPHASDLQALHPDQLIFAYEHPEECIPPFANTLIERKCLRDDKQRIERYMIIDPARGTVNSTESLAELASSLNGIVVDTETGTLLQAQIEWVPYQEDTEGAL